jgi:hypothetical protein
MYQQVLDDIFSNWIGRSSVKKPWVFGSPVLIKAACDLKGKQNTQNGGFKS